MKTSLISMDFAWDIVSVIIGQSCFLSCNRKAGCWESEIRVWKCDFSNLQHSIAHYSIHLSALSNLVLNNSKQFSFPHFPWETLPDIRTIERRLRKLEKEVT